MFVINIDTGNQFDHEPQLLPSLPNWTKLVSNMQLDKILTNVATHSNKAKIIIHYVRRAYF